MSQTAQKTKIASDAAIGPGTNIVPLSPTTEIAARILAREKPLFRNRLKRSFDIAGAAGAIVLFAPLMAILWCLVKLDGGPALFGHTRIGAGGRPFTCWKFRSMVVNANEVLAELLRRDPAAAQAWARDFKLKHDPRITGIGRVLRETSLDELPQLWNILRGDMSLVGPRPIVREEMARYGVSIVAYLSCRPGLTGLWQVSGRNDVTYAERVELDQRYTLSWSLGRDISIILKTVGVVLKRSGY